jgi:radical SAM superfamily enzyme YgiQ (UPF0313 family)
MKIALINPPFPQPEWLIRLIYDHNVPLGLASIAAYVRREGHDVKIFDPEPCGMPLDRMWREIEAFKPDLAGVTSVTPNFMMARQLAMEAKKRLGCLVLMGGPHANALPRSTLHGVPGLDAVILGEGEIPVAAIAAEFDAGRKVDFNKIPGAAFFENWKYKQTPCAEPLADLDALPYPARDLVDLKFYYKHRYFFGGKKSATVLTSRGCPSQCTFCANICMGRKFRAQSPARVVAELAHLVEKYGIRHFQIYDDCFTADPRRVAGICDLILAKKLKITWGAFGRVNTLLDEELIRKMKSAGCVHILLGIESGNQKILDLMKKNTTLAAAEKCCALLRRHGIIYTNSLMLGCEGETEETVMETIAFAKKLKADLVNFVIFIPFPGTPIFDKYYKDYDKPETDWGNWCSQGLDRPTAPRQTALSMADLVRLHGRAYQSYNSDPLQVLRTLFYGIRV